MALTVEDGFLNASRLLYMYGKIYIININMEYKTNFKK